MPYLNDVPWGLIWFAAIIIMWVVQGLSRVGKASQRQAAVAEAQAAAKAKALAQTTAAAVAPTASAVTHQLHSRRPHTPQFRQRTAVAAPYTGPAAASPLTLPGLGAEHQAHHPHWLTTFTLRNRLLAAIIVGEALRPPIGIRPHEQR